MPRCPLEPGFASGGATAVEFALILPVALLCILGLIEFSRAIWTQTTLDYAVQTAARCAAVNPGICGTATQIQQNAVDNAPGLALPTSTFSTSAQPCGAQVTASLQFDFLVRALLPYSQTLRASACFPL